MTISYRVLYLMAFSIPFSYVGPEFSGFVIAPAFLLGLTYVMLAWPARYITRTQVPLLIMLIGFLLTALGRHPFDSYVLSLAALGASTLPVSRPLTTHRAYSAFSSGFKAGLAITIAVVGIEIIAQLAGAKDLYNAITGLVRNSEVIIREHNYFIAYYRPYGFTAEPAHLGLYLVSGFIFLDVSRERGILQHLTLPAIFFTGSISSMLLLTIYLAFRLLRQISVKHIYSYRRVLLSLMAIILAIALLVNFWPALESTLDNIRHRVLEAIFSIQQGELTGSEGSRANAFISLTTYWEQRGLVGVLFGTGYANYSEWVADNFYQFGILSALARGQVNNILVAVTLSTGLFGAMLFINFIASMLHSNRVRLLSAIGVYALSFQFFYGTITAYFYWYLLFAVFTSHNFSTRRW